MGVGTLVRPARLQIHRQAEVEEHDPAGGRHQHVGRLDVAVQLAGGVQGREPVRQLAQGVPQALRPRAPDVVEERDPRHQFHREEPVVVRGNQLVQGDEVGVGDAGPRVRNSCLKWASRV